MFKALFKKKTNEQSKPVYKINQLFIEVNYRLIRFHCIYLFYVPLYFYVLSIDSISFKRFNQMFTRHIRFHILHLVVQISLKPLSIC
jgi:hypothetical protein